MPSPFKYYLILLVYYPTKLGRKGSVLSQRKYSLKWAFSLYIENSTKVYTIMSHSDFTSARSSLLHYFFSKLSSSEVVLNSVWVCKSLGSLRHVTTDSDYWRNKERRRVPPFPLVVASFDLQHFFKTGNCQEYFLLSK